MLTQQQILDHLSNGGTSRCIDGRDFSRLADFFPAEQVKLFGFEILDSNYVPLAWTEAEVLTQLASDVAFGFKKALDQRANSASLMARVIEMWLWVLEDPLADFDQYAQYGLPLLKQVAVKYGFPNEIGNDFGDETKYSAGYGDD
jgi:hypothetical protein